MAGHTFIAIYIRQAERLNILNIYNIFACIELRTYQQTNTYRHMIVTWIFVYDWQIQVIRYTYVCTYIHVY